MNPARRLNAIRERMHSECVDAYVVASPANVAYLTGFEGVFDEEPSSICVVTSDDAEVFVDSRYVEAAQAAAVGGAWKVSGPESDVWESVLAKLDSMGGPGGASFALESSVPHARYAKVSQERDGRLHAADSWVEAARRVKEPEEIDRIAAAAGLADEAFEHVLGAIGIGVTESEIALELELFMRRNGSEGVAFPSIVASGPNASRPHAKAGDRAFRQGDMIVMDFGARVGGYCSDMTRTVALGPVEGELRQIYEVVLAANEAGICGVRAGRTGAEIDLDARRCVADAGYGERFRHSLGHGVGIEVHEEPSVGPRGTQVIPNGAVITIEPGIYVPDLGGVRIEDLVVVGEEGPVVLSRSPKNLMEL